MKWTIQQILQATGGRLLCGPDDATFEGVGIDSRTIAAGQLFVAIRGERHDGHTFIDQVIGNGVQGVVVMAGSDETLRLDRWQTQGAACVAVADTTRALGALAAFQRNRFDIPVVAITGSNGKTSTRQMTTQVMAQQFNTLSTQGNFNNEIGLPLTLFNLSPRHEAAVLELGMNHPGELARLGAICRPTIGMITNVGPGHLEFLGSLEGVAQAKEELIARIDPHGTVVLNMDDPHVFAMAQRSGRHVLFFGFAPQADVQARDIRETSRGVVFELKLPTGIIDVVLATPGRFMTANALAAASAGYLAGLSPDQIKAGLETFAPTKGRLQVITTALGVSIIDDTYNANPASMAAAFDTLAALRRDRPAIIVLGDMLELGEQSETLHRQVGELAAASGADRLYAYGTHAHAVLEGAGRGGMAATAMFAGSKETIGADVIGHLAPGHWVLVKGSRGMAMETVVEMIRQWAQEKE
jgi:UDP-N-acetylmuramoyl-tripeptide--D-alanyl-D-alanine ligase